MQPSVFIDGEAGTTGLQIRSRLEARRDITVLSIAPEKRKDESERRRLLNEADVAILCLPDAAARQAAELVTSSKTVILDASSAHRTDPNWVYGFPEMAPGQKDLIRQSKRISNPGCYPTGFIALMRPLVEAGLVPRDFPVTVHAVSGFTGGGRAMIEAFETGGEGYRAYGLAQTHKHAPEMRAYSGLTHAPMFMPSVAHFAQGMLVEVPLPLWSLPGTPSPGAIGEAWQAAYDGAQFISVHVPPDVDHISTVEPEACNGTNRMDLFLFGSGEQARLIARLDNLGKGAAGAAVQNLNLILGADEGASLSA
ncbi:MAG: N-acetyl-gamma-glutamyl-phosphate reductase [Pseudomonadota bacterium]